ncbi:MAG: asparagine--tRNA ligase [Oscillospiraceae bacterium]|jgi:asparaginyl-tRNA synthetase|nr:asparagine--tRNA ligase [Oscillospiraceae bacterium]
MQHTTVRALYRQPPAQTAQVRVSGWVRTVRDSKTFAFIELNDGTFFKNLQVVAEEGRLPNFAQVAHTTLGSALEAEGELIPTPGAKQPFELKADKITLVGPCPADYPLQKKRHGFEYLRTIAHLRPRTNTFGAVFRIRSLAAQAIHQFFHDRDFVYVHTPIITGNDCEGAGEMFRVTTLDAQTPPRDAQGCVQDAEDFFGKRVSLTVSGQLNGEAFALAFRNIYTFGPTFRAERSFTPRHAAEFWMIEPEIAFADLSVDMDLAEDMVRYVIRRVLEEAPEELAFLNSFVDTGLLERLNLVANADFARITYTQAIDLLQKSGTAFEYPVAWGCDLQTEHERYLTEQHFHRPVFVHDYPKEIKAFYMRMNDDHKTVAAADMLVPGIGELVGGSQREERTEALAARMAELGLDPAGYWWYMDLRRYGGVPHAGFGLGFERLVMYLTGISNIRDVLPFPRTTGSADF